MFRSLFSPPSLTHCGDNDAVLALLEGTHVADNTLNCLVCHREVSFALVHRVFQADLSVSGSNRAVGLSVSRPRFSV